MSGSLHETKPAGVLQLLTVAALFMALTSRAEETTPARTPPMQRSESNTNVAPADHDDLPRFVINSPFSREYHSPVPREGKRLWATSRLWEKAPGLVVEEWLTAEPNREGKFLLIEFWATWCGPCQRTIPELNTFQRRFKDDLVVIGISDEDVRTVRAFKRSSIEYAMAVDTQARMKKELGVIGIPHVIVVEPGGHVVWEGFPLLEGHELTEAVLATIIESVRKGTTPVDKAASGPWRKDKESTKERNRCELLQHEC